MKNKLQNHFGSHWSIYVLGMLYVVTRVIFLEADLPSWDKVKYQTIDELYYAMPAFEWMYKRIDELESFPINVFQSLFAFPILKSFGLSYFWLRMTSVVMGGFGVFFVYLAYLNEVGTNKGISTFARNMIFFLCASMIVFNYGFYYSTAVLEPSVSIALYSAILLFILARYSGNYLLIGVAIAFGPVFVYPPSIYLSVAALAALILVKGRDIRWRDIRDGLLGLSVVALSFVLILYVYYKDTWLESLQTIRALSSQRIVSIASDPLPYLVENFFTMVRNTNLFFYSHVLMVCTALSLFALLLVSVKNFRRLNLVVVCALLMLMGRAGQLIFEKTHYERKTIDIALVVLLILLQTLILFWPFVSKYIDKLSISNRMKSVGISMLVAMGLLLNYANASVLLSDLTSKKNYNNRDVLLDLGKKFAGCLAIGEWGHGFNIYGMYNVKLLSYKYALPSQYGDYSEKFLKLLEDKNAVVISSYPQMSPKLSKEAKSQLVPVYQFDIKDSEGAAAKFAVYRPLNRIVNGESVECAH